MPAPDRFRQLVETFGNNLDDYKSGAFNEAQARQQFINPLFKLLGWDMDTESGTVEAEKKRTLLNYIYGEDIHSQPDRHMHCRVA